MGWKFFRMLGSRFDFLRMGVMIACLYIGGTTPWFSEFENMSHSSWAMSSVIACNSLMGIGSSVEEEMTLRRSLMISEVEGTMKELSDCVAISKSMLLSLGGTGSALTKSVTLFEKKLSKMAGS